jgi:hypothetical protein
MLLEPGYDVLGLLNEPLYFFFRPCGDEVLDIGFIAAPGFI